MFIFLKIYLRLFIRSESGCVAQDEIKKVLKTQVMFVSNDKNIAYEEKSRVEKTRQGNVKNETKVSFQTFSFLMSRFGEKVKFLIK